MLKLMRRIRRVRPVRPPPSAFTGFRFPREMIVLAVRWYLRYGLSYRDVEELLAERGVQVDHVTVCRWVRRFTPLLTEAARPCRHAVGDRWWVDETYVKVSGAWRYVYRAVDQFGQVIDVYLSTRRDTAAARGTVALSDRPTRAGRTCAPRSHSAGLGCRVCHGFPRVPRRLFVALDHGRDARRLNATVPTNLYSTATGNPAHACRR